MEKQLSLVYLTIKFKLLKCGVNELRKFGIKL